MKIIGYEFVEGCLEGKNVYDLFTDAPVTEEFVNYMGELGKLIYNTTFDKPFYRIVVKGKFTLKGSVDFDIIRVLLPYGVGEEYVIGIINYFEKFQSKIEKTVKILQ